MKNGYLLFLLLLCASITAGAQSANQTKLSSMIANLAYTPQEAKARSSTQNDGNVPQAVTVLVKLANESDAALLTDAGCVVLDNVDNIYFTLMPCDAIVALSLDERVLRIEANPLMRILTDSLAGSSNILPVYKGADLPQAYTGKGVIMGVVDEGFDYTNPMFRDSEGHTRIRQAWDIFTGKAAGYKNIGSLYTTESEILAAHGSSDSTGYHGTNTASIAAGSPVKDGKYCGVAYESDLVLSSAYLLGATQELTERLTKDLNNALATGDEDIKKYLNGKLVLTDVITVLSIKQTFEYATEQNKPCVVNCSFGRGETLNNDYELTHELINKMTGPGRIVVAASGNYSDTDPYRLKKADETLSTTLWFKKDYNPSFSMRSDKSFNMTMTPDIDGFGTLTISSEEIPVSPQGIYKYIHAPNDESINFGVKEATKYLMSDGTYGYSITLQLPEHKKEVIYNTASIAFTVEGEGDVQIMGTTNALGFTRFSTYPSNSPYTIYLPSGFDEVISVGAMNYRDSLVNLNGVKMKSVYNNNEVGRIVSWSGTGPTLSGKVKPDIAAAGFSVVEADNSLMPKEKFYSDEGFNKNVIDSLLYNGKYYFLRVNSGTSMSSAVVSGIIALWLQADPTLTPKKIKEVMSRTATHPDESLTYPNNMYGYGAIDAYKGLCDIIGLAQSIENFPDHQPEGVSMSLRGRTLIMNGLSEATLRIYSISGTLMMTATTNDGTVSLDSLNPGVYAVVVEGKGSWIVRVDN